MISYGYWILQLEISRMRYGVRFLTGIGLCIFQYLIYEMGNMIYLRHKILHLMISHLRKEVRFGTGIGFCSLGYRIEILEATS